MPKLCIIAACEKVIYDAQGMPSLINIFQRVRIQVGTPFPPEALSPLSWAVFLLWQHTPEEHGVEFSQLVEVIGPDGKHFASVPLTFKVTEPGDLQSKNAVNIFGIPAANEGIFTVRARLGDGDAAGEYPFFLEHVGKEKIDDNAATSAVN